MGSESNRNTWKRPNQGRRSESMSANLILLPFFNQEFKWQDAPSADSIKSTNQNPAVDQPTNQNPALDQPTNQIPAVNQPTNENPEPVQWTGDFSWLRWLASKSKLKELKAGVYILCISIILPPHLIHS